MRPPSFHGSPRPLSHKPSPLQLLTVSFPFPNLPTPSYASIYCLRPAFRTLLSFFPPSPRYAFSLVSPLPFLLIPSHMPIFPPASRPPRPSSLPSSSRYLSTRPPSSSFPPVLLSRFSPSLHTRPFSPLASRPSLHSNLVSGVSSENTRPGGGGGAGGGREREFTGR